MPAAAQREPLTTGPGDARNGRSFWLLLATSVIVVLVSPLPYAFASLTDLAKDGFGLAAYYTHRAEIIRVALYLHIAFASTALLLSPLQLSARLRSRHPALHRVVGRVVIGSIMVGAPAGLVLAPRSQAGLVGTAGFGLLAVLWATFAVLTLRAARRRDLAAHRRWASRTFALTYAGVTLRLWLLLLTPLVTALTGASGEVAFDRAYRIVPFLSWVPNLLGVEWLLRRAASPRRQPGLQS